MEATNEIPFFVGVYYRVVGHLKRKRPMTPFC
jgi:hypothetical protein